MKCCAPGMDFAESNPSPGARFMMGLRPASLWLALLNFIEEIDRFEEKGKAGKTRRHEE